MTPPAVLVIEDDADVGKAIRTVLGRAGDEVVVAVNGRDGLRRFEAPRPALVILDIGPSAS